MLTSAALTGGGSPWENVAKSLPDPPIGLGLTLLTVPSFKIHSAGGRFLLSLICVWLSGSGLSLESWSL